MTLIQIAVELDADPFIQFGRWFEDARAVMKEPEAMALATATPDGRPSVRMVLLRGWDQHGFCFFTNYESRKGEELAANARAALLFHWREHERQIRIEGSVVKVTPEESDAYFASRPYGSRVASSASPQSRVLASREVLLSAIDALGARHPEEQGVPRPDFWGGFRVIPERFEMWQGRPSRIHERLVYRKTQDSWVTEILAP